MAKKITKKKKNKLKGFSPEETIMDLEMLLSSPGWAVVMKICEGNIEDLNQMIIEKMEGKEILTEAEVDRLRDKRGYLKELMETPQNYIEHLSENTTKPEDFDPYFKSAKELIASRRK